MLFQIMLLAILWISLPAYAANTTPTTTAFSTSTLEDTVLTINLTPYAADADGNALTFYKSTAYKGTVTVTTAGIATFTPTANYYGTAGYFNFYVKDSAGSTSSSAKVSITITSVNDAPTASAVSVSASEDVKKTATLSGSDPDGDALTYSIVTNPSHGTITTPSGATTYYTGSANYNGTDSFTYKVTDASGSTSSPATVSVTVSAVNDAPTANALTQTTNEDTPVTFTLTGSDVDGNALTYSIYTAPSATAGTAIISGNQATFTPYLNYTGSPTFKVRAHDGTTYSSAATITMTITAVGDAPTANAVTTSPSEDVKKTVTLSGSDPDGDALTYSIVTDPSHGTVTTPSGATTYYTGSTNYNGTDSFTYKVTDASGNSSAPATVSVTVTAVNDTPTLGALSKTTDEDTPITFTLTGSDVDGDTLTYSIYTAPSATAGTASISGDQVTFTPSLNYTGSPTFKVKAHDGTTYSSTATMTMTVTAVNDAPVAAAASAMLNEDASSSITLSATDAENSSLTYQLVDSPAHGTATLSSRTVTYTPTVNYNGTDTFTFKAYETSSTSSVSNTATVSLTVSPVNDSPTASNITATTNENVPVVLTLNASDIDGDTLTYAFGTPTGGTVSQTDGITTYTPNSTNSGTDTFTYTASDGTLSASANVTVTVAAINAVPVATNASLTTTEDTAVTTTLVATDAEGDAFSYYLATDGEHGTVVITDDQAVYTPEDNFHGTDSFTFTANDASGVSEAATISITVTSVNDDPIVEDVTAATTENTAVAIPLTASDVDTDNLSYQIIDSDQGLTEVSENTLTFTPDTDFDGVATVHYEVTDGRIASNTGTVTITVTGTNSAPVAKNLTDTIKEDHEKSITLRATDPEGEALTYVIATAPAHGSASVADDTVTYTPDTDFYGSDSFTYTASDGSNTSDAATVTLTVRALPDPVVDCELTLDPSHLQTDTTSGLQYWDNLVEVVMDAPATAAQLTELTTTAGSTGNVCKVELSAMSTDEQAHLANGTDTSDLDFAEYRFEIATQANLADVASIATNLRALSYVTYARAAYVYDNPVVAAETDVENRGAVDNMAIPDYFRIIQLEGALEYLAAYDDQGNTLASIALAMGDTGVCASYGYASWCYDPPSGIQAEFTNVKNGINLVGELDPTATGQTSSMPLGLIDPHEGMHGTNVAALMASESNGSTGPSDNGVFTNDVWSGIVGSVPDLDFTLTSYMYNSGDKYTWKSYHAETLLFVYYAATCGDDVVNSSFVRSYYAEWEQAHTAGQSLPNDYAADKSAFVIGNLCDTLYVWGAGNDGKDFDTNPDYADYQYYSYGTNDNSIGVQGTEKNSTTRSDGDGWWAGSNYGTGISIAAPGNFTSYSAPLVTGTAGLLKAVDSSLSPSELIQLLQVGENTPDTGTPFLDTAASVLMAIDGKDDDYVPLSIKSLKFRNSNATLSELRADEDYTDGTHSEEGLWTLSGETLTIKRDGVQESVDGGPQPYQQWLDDDLNGEGFTENENSSVESRLTTTNHYQIGLTTVTDSNSASRTIPVLTALPKGQQTVKLEGKFASGGYDAPGGLGYTAYDTNVLDVGTSYSFQLDYTMNASELNADKGFRVLLGRESESNGYTVPHNITGAELHGTAVVYVYGLGYDGDISLMPSDAISTGKHNVEWFGGELPNLIEFSLENMDLPDTSAFPVGSGASNMEAFADIQFDYRGSSSSSQFYYEDAAYLFYNIDVTFSDFSCAGVQANSSSKDWNDPTTDISIASDSLILQTFEHRMAAASASTCIVTANYTVTTTVNREYGFYTFNNSDTSTFSETLIWDLTDGIFPVPEVFSFIKMNKPEEHMLNSNYTGDPYFGENSILPTNMIHSGQITPAIGIDDREFNWAHGIGPLERDMKRSDGRNFELTDLNKTDRTVR